MTETLQRQTAGDCLTRLVRGSLPVLIEALYAASQFEESYADAHTLKPWEMTDELKKTAEKARAKAGKYLKLRKELISANDKQKHIHE